MFSTSGDVQYIWGCSVHQGIFSTSGHVQYIGGDTMSTLGDIMSTLGDTMIHWGYSVHQRDIMGTSEDVQYIEGYHVACRGYH